MISHNEQIYGIMMSLLPPFVTLPTTGAFYPGLHIVERIKEYCVDMNIKAGIYEK